MRLPARIWPAYDHLQSLRTLGTTRYLGKPVPQTCRERTIHRHADDQFHARESAPLGGRRKRGEAETGYWPLAWRAQRKIHALADAKGRLIAILLTGGEAHDFPLAKRLIRRVNPPEHLLGDMAYDGDELREELERHRTKSVIPNRPNRRHPFSFSKRLYKLRWAHRERLQQVEGLPPYRNSLRQAGAKLPRICLPRRSPCMVDLMSLNPSLHQLLHPSL